MSGPSSENILKILISTDNHLGYLERDPVRGNDSFTAFEEIFEHAVEHDVDMVLLGGDIFHDNKPSRRTIYRTLEILRKYTLGERDIKIQVPH